MKSLHESILDDDDILLGDVDFHTLTKTGEENINKIRIWGFEEFQNKEENYLDAKQCIQIFKDVLNTSKIPKVDYNIFDRNIDIFQGREGSNKAKLNKSEKQTIYNFCEMIMSSYNDVKNKSAFYEINTIEYRMRRLISSPKALKDYYNIGTEFRNYTKFKDYFMVRIYTNKVGGIAGRLYIMFQR